MIYRKVREVAATGRHPDRPRRRPLDHLAVGHRDRRGPPPGQHRHRPFRCPRRHRQRRLGACSPSHGTPMRRLIESGAVKGRNFVQVGLRGYWPPRRDVRLDAGAGPALALHARDRGARRGGGHRRGDRRGARRPRLHLPVARHRRHRSRAWRPAPARPSRAACSPARSSAPSARSSARSSSPGWTSSRSRRRTTRPRRRRWPPTAPRSRRSAPSPCQAPGGPTRALGGLTIEPWRGSIGPIAADRAPPLARLYDLDLLDDPGDLDLYLALADRADGPILELAAGTRPAGGPAGRGRPPGHRRRPRPGDARPGAAPRGRDRRRRDRLTLRRGRPRRAPPARRRALRPRVHRAQLAAAPAEPRGTARGAADAGRPPRARAAWRSSTSGCPTPRTSPGSTAGSSSSGRGAIRRPGTS